MTHEWTYTLAQAAARDAANRNMVREGRTAWSQEDYNVAVETFNRLCPEPEARDDAAKAL